MKGMGGFGKDHKKIVFCLFLLLMSYLLVFPGSKEEVWKVWPTMNNSGYLLLKGGNIMNERLFQSDIRMVSEDNFLF